MKRVQSSRLRGEAEGRGGDRVTSGHMGVNNGERRSERVKPISTGITNENGFRGEILSIFPVFKERRSFQRDFGTLSQFRVNSSRKDDFI